MLLNINYSFYVIYQHIFIHYNIENSKFISQLPEISDREINLYDPLPPPDGISPYGTRNTSAFTRISDFENVLVDDLRTFLDRVPVSALLT